MLSWAVEQTMEKPCYVELDVIIVLDKLMILSVGLITWKLTLFHNFFILPL